MRSYVKNLLVVIIPIIIILSVALRAETPLPSVDEILNRYIDVLGGREAIEKIETRVISGKVTTDLTSRKYSIYEVHYFEAYSKIPDMMYTITYTDAGNFERGYDGRIGWVKDRCGVEEKADSGKRRLDWLLNPQNALRIEEYYPSLTVKGTERVRGMEVYVLESPELHRPLFFEIKTGLLIGFGHNWEIHDYRDVGGVLFPHKIAMSRKGGSTVYEFERIDHNLPVEDSLFTIPE